MPNSCPYVPDNILNPKNTWLDKMKYDEKANELAIEFNNNFSKFIKYANDEILEAAPKSL